MDFDLFGNPVTVQDEKRGRPEHEPTEENIISAMVLLAAGSTNAEVAKTLGLSVPTFRKHYLHLIRQKELLHDRLRTKLQVAQIKQGLAGNASALNAALAQLDKVRIVKAERSVAKRGSAHHPQRAVKPPKLGKKEERQAAADAVDGKFAPPEPPRLAVDNTK